MSSFKAHDYALEISTPDLSNQANPLAILLDLHQTGDGNSISLNHKSNFTRRPLEPYCKSKNVLGKSSKKMWKMDSIGIFSVLFWYGLVCFLGLVVEAWNEVEF